MEESSPETGTRVREEEGAREGAQGPRREAFTTSTLY